ARRAAGTSSRSRSSRVAWKGGGAATSSAPSSSTTASRSSLRSSSRRGAVSRPAIVDLIVERRRQHPGGVYLRFGGRDVTWAELADSMWSAANRFRGVGVEPGDRVAIMLPNSPEYLFAYFGALAAGAATVPVNTAQRGAALEHILRDSGSVAIVLDESLRDLVGDEPTVIERTTLSQGEAEEFSLPP